MLSLSSETNQATWSLGTVWVRQGLPGGSVFRAVAGYGRHGQLHEAHFIELAGELPMEVVFAVSDADADRLLDTLRQAGLDLVYVRIAAEVGRVGG